MGSTRNKPAIFHLTGIFLLLVVASNPLIAADVAARVQFVAGEVYASSPTGEVRRLSKSDEIYPGDTLESADSSSAQLLFTDNGRIAVRANTRLTIREYKYDADNPAESGLFVNLLEGAIRSITGWIGQFHQEGVIVTTPIASIGIRGTDHETIHILPDPDGNSSDIAGTYDKVYSGATELRSDSGTILLNPNQVGFVGGLPGSVGVPNLIDALPQRARDMIALRIPQRTETQSTTAETARARRDGKSEKGASENLISRGKVVSSGRNRGGQGELSSSLRGNSRGLGNSSGFTSPGLGNSGANRNGPPVRPSVLSNTSRPGNGPPNPPPGPGNGPPDTPPEPGNGPGNGPPNPPPGPGNGPGNGPPNPPPGPGNGPGNGPPNPPPGPGNGPGNGPPNPPPGPGNEPGNGPPNPPPGPGNGPGNGPPNPPPEPGNGPGNGPPNPPPDPGNGPGNGPPSPPPGPGNGPGNNPNQGGG